ncbi:hypothetical protein [Burkholderia thailandensis]|uniref:hypothetical protein n=1 Tax=Burkholderia thailandensis TaxID=57975 RepID=UPI0004B2B92B|nr:hypothetical protein [Burkholderia thailandensis]MCZ2894965.1 hypothetical protein [Burkholderia thailandensis]
MSVGSIEPTASMRIAAPIAEVAPREPIVHMRRVPAAAGLDDERRARRWSSPGPHSCASRYPSAATAARRFLNISYRMP